MGVHDVVRSLDGGAACPLLMMSMLWLVLKYYGFTLREMFGFTVIMLLMINHFHYGWVSETILNEYRSEFATFGRFPTLKKRNNLPEPVRRKFKNAYRIYIFGQFGLFAILCGVGALAKHYNW